MESDGSGEDEKVLTPDRSCNEDEVEFVGARVKDHIDYQKAHVQSTLDRLARHVEIEKQQREEKNKAFQETVYFQHAHGLQELEFIKDSPDTNAARYCVNQWLKAPGPRPGVIRSNRRPINACNEQVARNTQPITCPIMHCNRVFDNGQLLMGHLKRFDHSPCDPAITLHGAPVNLYACVLCSEFFKTKKEYIDHLTEKAKSNDGHEISVSAQVIQCFACPKCFLLFNIRDECLKHMSAKNHCTQAFKLQDIKCVACPIPMPSYAKKVLIALCKDVAFRVFCTSCQASLRSHMDLTAHFRTRCRNAGPTSRSEMTIAEVSATFLVKAFCPHCRQALQSENHIARHTEKTKHKVKIIKNMAESILAFCVINEGQKTPSDFCSSDLNASLKRVLKRPHDGSDLPSPKITGGSQNRRFSNSIHGKSDSSERVEVTMTVWFCECSRRFSSEQDAGKHILIANQICHKCAVCRKTSDELSIIQLHMSRFHGGAHLNNFHQWCKKCLVQLHGLREMMNHIKCLHGGHSFYSEQVVGVDEPTASTSKVGHSLSILPSEPSSSTTVAGARGKWQCHVCEEMFDSEETVIEHSKCLDKHQFHKFSCVLCNKHFHKLETLYRHGQQQHGGEIKMKYFCGLCEDVYFEEELDFHNHYECFHSTDYAFVPDEQQSLDKVEELVTPSVGHVDYMTCGCQQSYTCETDRIQETAQCLARLLREGRLWYSCPYCPATAKSIKNIRMHLCKVDKAQIEKEFVVRCILCAQSFSEVVTAHQHYHKEHCTLNTNVNLGPGTLDMFTVKEECINENTMKMRHLLRSSPPTKMKSEKVETAMLNLADKESSRDTVHDNHSGENEIDLPDLDYLQTMTHMVFVDLDNWANFFTLLPGYLNQGTFVWGFQGGQTNWKPPVNCKVFKNLSNTGSFFLHPHSSHSKDAANAAICVQASCMDEQLPKQIPFIILSGDEGYLALDSQFKNTQRPMHILNSHHIDGEHMAALLNSISETFPDSDDGSTEDHKVPQDEDADIQEAIRRSLTEV
uniref:Zinc finger protein 451 n=1 Tax=Leptobrachium leishanense TaxID=445787 RepID=A0A8C5PJR9_9ANUR